MPYPGGKLDNMMRNIKSPPEGFKLTSRFHRDRFANRFGSFVLDTTLPFYPHVDDSPQTRREKLILQAKYFRKLADRSEGEANEIGKAGRPLMADTLTLFRKYYEERKPWNQCFKELWEDTGNAPKKQDLAATKERLRRRVKAYWKRIRPNGNNQSSE